MKNILAIDYGEKHIGVAYKIGDGPTVPTDMILPRNTDALEEIDKVIKNHSINIIVLGLPLDFSGKIGHQAKITMKFGQKIKDKCDILLEYSDERLTSKLIEDTLPNSHSLVAAHILDNYILRRKNE